MKLRSECIRMREEAAIASLEVKAAVASDIFTSAGRQSNNITVLNFEQFVSYGQRLE